MEDLNPIFMGIFAVIFIAAWITSFISFFNILAAQDRITYYKSIALFVGPILLILTLAEISGLIPETNLQNNPPPEFIDAYNSIPAIRQFLLVVGFAIWFVGGNALLIAHRRRTNKKWWYWLNPISLFNDFNAKEWVVLVLLVIVSLVLITIGLDLK